MSNPKSGLNSSSNSSFKADFKNAWGSPFSLKDTFSGANVANMAKGAISAVGNIGGKYAGSALSGGLESTAGSIVGDVGGLVGAGLSFVNPVLGGIVALGSGLLSGGINSLFGSKINKERVNSIEASNRGMNNLIVDSSTNNSILDQWASQSFGSEFSKRDIGKDGVFSDKAENEYNRLKAQQAAARMRALSTYKNAINTADTQSDLRVLSNFAAYGGPINIFGGGAINYELAKENLYNKQLDVMSKYKIPSMPNSFEAPEFSIFANGGKIHIKPENRGKFTALKKKTGKSTTWFKEHGTPTQRKMATFALNAKKWKHEFGGNLYKDGGPEKKAKRVDFSTYKPLFDRGFIPENMEQLQDSLINRGYNDAQRLAIMANVLHESGGDPKAVSDSGKYKGIIQWGLDRYPNTEDLGEQIHSLIVEANTPSSPAWSDGGGGVPFIRNLQQGYDNFWESDDPYNATLYYTKGSVRPKDQKARINRAEEARNMFKNLKANGGSLIHQHGGDFSNGVTIIGNGGTHEENPMEGVLMGVAPDGTPNLVEQDEVKFNNYIFSNRLFATEKLLAAHNLPTTYADHSFADIAERLSKESSERPNDPISNRGLMSAMTRLQQAQEQVRMEKNKEDNKYAHGGKMGKLYDGLGNIPNILDFYSPHEIWLNEMVAQGKIPSYDNYAVFNEPYNFEVPNIIDTTSSSTKRLNSTLRPIQVGLSLETEPTSSKQNNGGLSWLRYAPVVGAGLNVLSDALGWTNKPDYSNADLVGSAVDNLSNISFTPIGNYLTYKPLDRNHYINKLNAQAGATRRAIINQSGGNRATALAGLLAADYNAQSVLGDLARQAEEYNFNQRKEVEAFNRGTNQFNSEMGLKARIANKENDRLRLQARITQAQLRDQADARASAGRSANLTNLFDSLGEIGREEFSRNMIDSNPALNYSIDRKGKVSYKKDSNNSKKSKEKSIKKKIRKNRRNRNYLIVGE